MGPYPFLVRCDIACPGDSSYSCGEGVAGPIYKVGSNYKQPSKLTDMSGWAATASSSSDGAPGLVIDGATSTSFATGRDCCYQWIQAIFVLLQAWMLEKMAAIFIFLRPRMQVDLGQSTLVHGLGLEFRTGHPDLVTNLEVRRMTKLFPNVLKHFLPLGKGYFLCEDIIRTTFLLVDPSGRHKCRNSYSSKWKQNQRPNHICSTIHITFFSAGKSQDMRQQGLPHIMGITGSKPSGQKNRLFPTHFIPNSWSPVLAPTGSSIAWSPSQAGSSPSSGRGRGWPRRRSTKDGRGK